MIVRICPICEQGNTVDFDNGSMLYSVCDLCKSEFAGAEQVNENKKRHLTKFKPCPFCGNTDPIRIVRRVYDGTCEELQGKVYWYVECMDCDGRTGNQWDGDSEAMGFYEKDGFKSGRDVAVYMWNLRKEPENEQGT